MTRKLVKAASATEDLQDGGGFGSPEDRAVPAPRAG